MSLKTHGLSKTKEYRTWQRIKQRCYNPNHDKYEHYGGKGIYVCESWYNSFEAFFSDMGPCPRGYTIERVDNLSGYCPKNCIWLPAEDQNKNRIIGTWNGPKRFACKGRKRGPLPKFKKAKVLCMMIEEEYYNQLCRRAFSESAKQGKLVRACDLIRGAAEERFPFCETADLF